MTMHLLPVFYTTTNTRSRKPKKQDTSKHDKWLMERGLLPSQIKAKKTANTQWKSEYAKSLECDGPRYNSSGLHQSCGVAPKTDIMTNLHKESEHVRKAVLEKASRTAPLYSKGPYQYITDGSSLSEIGKKM